MPRRRDADLLTALGQRLQRLRKARGWTQERLAEALDLQPVTLSRLETGDRAVSLTVLADAATILGVGLGDLLDVARPEPVADDDADLAEGTAILRSLDAERRDLALRLLREVARARERRRPDRRSRR